MRIPILMYHSVSEAADGSFGPFAVRPGDFSAQMALLAELGHATLTVADLAVRLVAGQALPARPVVVTFDDGFKDFMSHALPVLAAHRLVATQYVVSDLVGATSRWLDDVGEGGRPLMDAAAVREAHAAGIEIGAHTRTHPRLDALAPDRLHDEVAGSKARIEDMLGAPVTTFAYPFGLYEGAREIVREAGFAAACAVRYRTSFPGDDRFALARLIVRRDTGLDAFGKLLDGDDASLRMTFDRTRAAAWRVVRRAMRRG